MAAFVVFQTPLGPASTLATRSRTLVTVVILDHLRVRAAKQTTPTSWTTDVKDDEADVEDMEDEDPDARSQDHGNDFDASPRPFAPAGAKGVSAVVKRSASQQHAELSAARAQEEVRNSVLNPNLRRSGQSTKRGGWKSKEEGVVQSGRSVGSSSSALPRVQDKETEVLAAIDMRGVDSVVIEPLKDKRKDKDSGTDANQVAASTTFCLNLGGIVPRKYLLRADSVDTMREWVDAINERLSTYNRLSLESREIGGTDEPGARQAGRRNLKPQSSLDEGSPETSAKSAAPSTDDLAADRLNVRFVGSFIDVSKGSLATDPVHPKENLTQISGKLPLVMRESKNDVEAAANPWQS